MYVAVLLYGVSIYSSNDFSICIIIVQYQGYHQVIDLSGTLFPDSWEEPAWERGYRTASPHDSHTDLLEYKIEELCIHQSCMSV